LCPGIRQEAFERVLVFGSKNCYRLVFDRHISKVVEEDGTDDFKLIRHQVGLTFVTIADDDEVGTAQLDPRLRLRREANVLGSHKTANDGHKSYATKHTCFHT